MDRHGRLRSEERKVASVLFADLADSTALGERLDIEPLAQVMGAFHGAVRGAVERCHGSAEFVGDGVVAIFGAPTAVENHQGMALEAADQILEAVDRLDRHLAPTLGVRLGVRIGINTGDVLVDPTGDLSVGSMASDAFNVASRLEQIASVGEIVASERTVRAVRDRAVIDLGYLPIDGRAQPVRAFRVRRASIAGGKGGRSSGLVDRVNEMERLEAALRQVRWSQRSAIVTVIGEAGMGKSVLLSAFLDFVSRELPVSVASGGCTPFGRTGPLDPISRLLGSALGSQPPERAAIAEVLGEARHVDVLVRALGLEDPDFEPETAPGRAAEELTSAWRALISRLTDVGPWVFAVEDVHWADPETLDLLRVVVDAPGEGVLVVVTARPELDSDSWPETEYVIELAPLDQAGIEAVARSVEPSIDETPGMGPALHRLTEGNPFFAVELARTFSERADRVGSSPPDLRSLGVPDTIHGVLADRIDRLDPLAKRVLQSASMIGREFFPAPIADILEMDEPELEAALHRLRRRGMIEPTRDATTPFRFVHALTRDVAYGSISRRDLHGLHETVADWLEAHPEAIHGDTAATIAFHLGRACGSVRADWEATSEHVEAVRRRWIDWTIKATRRAIAATGFTEAKRLARVAIDNAVDDEQSVSAFECLGNAHFYSYEGDDAWEALTRAADLAASTRSRELTDVAILYIRALASTVRWAGGVRHPPIPQELKNRIELARELLPPGDSVERVQLLTVIGFWPYATVGQPETGLISEEAARAAALEAADMARRLGRVDLESAALDGLGSTHIFRGDYRAAGEVTDRRCGLYDELRDPWERGDLCAVAAWVAFQRGRYEAAIEWATRGVDGAGDDYPGIELHCRTWRGLARLRTGDWDALLDECSAVEQQLPHGASPAPYTTPLVAAAALVRHLRGEEDECDRLLRMITPSDEPEGPPLSRWAEFVAPIVARRGDPQTAFEMIDCTAHRRASRFGQLLIARCQVGIETGRWERFDEFVSDGRGFVEAHGVEGALPALSVVQGHGALSGGDLDGAVDTFERAFREAKSVGDLWWRGHASLGLATAYSRMEDAGAARSHRDAAVDAFTRLGSTSELQRAEAVGLR